MAIKNIVFDIGGVLADFNVNGFLSTKGFDAAMIKRILKASVMTPYWGQFERGELTEDETLQDELCKTLSEVIATTHVYTMECLPNSDAACLSHATLYSL